MIQIANTIAKLDFDQKTITFDADVRLADVHKLQASLKDWEEWRIVTQQPAVTITPHWNWGYWCVACNRNHGNFEVCQNSTTWITTDGSTVQA